jgi:hypothetical protein
VTCHAASAWTNLFYAYGIKTGNNQTDVGPGDKIMALFHDGPANRVRSDNTDTEGSITSITWDFPSGKWYINMLSSGMCVFEHTGTKLKPLPANDWVSILSKEGQATINGKVCDQYVIPKGDLSLALAFYFFDAADASVLYEIQYYQEQKTGLPVRFTIKNQGPVFAQQTNFDFIQFVSRKSSFPSDTFTQNIHDWCH